LRLCSEAEFYFLYGRDLKPEERQALSDAIALARANAENGRRYRRAPEPVKILEAAFAKPTVREMLRRNGHPTMWAMRFVALELSGRDPVTKPARRPSGPRAGNLQMNEGAC